MGMPFRMLLKHDSEAEITLQQALSPQGCASSGKSEGAARANIREAIDFYMAPGQLRCQ